MPATEQEVVAFNAAKPAVEVAAIYPTEGWVVSEVPVLGLNGSWVSDEQRAASEAFADFVVGGKAQQALQTAGWRAARLDTTVTPAAGVVPTEPEYTPAQPSQDVLARTLQNWTALDRRGSLLVVLDTSGSMKEEAGTTGKSRLQVAKDAVLASLPFFSDQARVGLWTFSRAARGNDYRAVVPLGRLDRQYGAGTARDNIAAAVPRIVAAGDTGLYDTTLAAVAAVREGWQPGPNTVVIISDGKNEDPGSPDLRTTLDRLVDGADPSRPVEVVTIALGSGADAKALAQHRGDHQGQGLHGGPAGGPRVGVPDRPHRLTRARRPAQRGGSPGAGGYSDPAEPRCCCDDDQPGTVPPHRSPLAHPPLGGGRRHPLRRPAASRRWS